MLVKILSRARRRTPRRRGATAVLMAVTMPVIVGFAAMTVDVGAMYNARNDLQRLTDAAALAAAGVVASTDVGNDPHPGAIAAAVEYAVRNHVMGLAVVIDPEVDIIFGHAALDAVTKEYSFAAGETPENAVRVSARLTEDSPNGSWPLFFAGVLGKSFTDISARAAAMFVDTQYEETDCWDRVPEGSVVVCMHGDKDDSDDSENGDSDDSDDSVSADSSDSSDSADSGESKNGDSDDSDDSEAGDSVDSDDSHEGGLDDSEDDSESHDDSDDSDGGRSILIDENAAGHFFAKGATLGACVCPEGDPDDSDDSEGGDSSDSDDSDGDGPGTDGDIQKITICHFPDGNPDHGQRLTIGMPSLDEHLAHGDAIGACTGTLEAGGPGAGNNGGRLLVVLIE